MLTVLSVAAFAISVLPVHVYSYAYICSADGQAEVTSSLYKLIPIFGLKLNYHNIQKLASRDKDSANKNDGGGTNFNLLEIYNKLCILKIIQLSDFGLQSGIGAYAALAQSWLTELLYAFVKCNGGKTKLRNYVVLNREHDNIVYYIKIVGVINLITLSRLFIVYLWGKLNERKN